MNNSIEKRTEELFNSIKDSNSLMELITKLYQNRPLHVTSDTDELHISIKLSPNKFVKKNLGKNINMVNTKIDINIVNKDTPITEDISFFGEGESVSTSIESAVKYNIGKIVNNSNQDESELFDHILDGKTRDVDIETNLKLEELNKEPHD